MKRLIAAAFIVLTAVVATQIPGAASSHAQDFEKEPAFVAETADKSDPARKQPKQDNLEKLRAEFVAVAKAQAEMMTETELTSALTRAKTEKKFVAAKREIEKARALLMEIAEKYPDTPAGGTAQRAGQVIDGMQPVTMQYQIGGGRGSTQQPSGPTFDPQPFELPADEFDDFREPARSGIGLDPAPNPFGDEFKPSRLGVPSRKSKSKPKAASDDFGFDAN